MVTHRANSIYKPLDAAREIRLLKIVHTHPEIVCVLNTVSLHDNPQFSALSYEWGDPATTRPIILNGSTTLVTTNLARALEHVCYHWTARFPDRDASSCRLWVDAICINQNDIHEKNQQIQLMETLYAGAEMVICWIGPLHRESQIAFESCMVLDMEIKRHPFELGKEVNLDWMKEYPEIFCENTPQDVNFGNRNWAAICRMLGSKYWKRVWILQELVLARNALIVCGKMSIELGSLLSIAEWFTQARRQNRPAHVSSTVWNTIVAPHLLGWECLMRIVVLKLGLIGRRQHLTPLTLKKSQAGWRKDGSCLRLEDSIKQQIQEIMFTGFWD